MHTLSATAVYVVLFTFVFVETGIVRDTVVFSILTDEWPAVSRGLQARFVR